MEKLISVSNDIKEALGIKSMSYDRGNVTIKVKRAFLRRWLRTVYWYTSSVFEPDTVELHYRAADLFNAIFGPQSILSYEPKKKEVIDEAPQSNHHA